MAWYRAGTIAVVNGSATVTGTGTAFVANVQLGHAINLPDGKAYEVASVDSNTQITLGSPYLGSTASSQPYSVQPNQGFSQQAATVLQGFLTQYSSYGTTSLAGRFQDGSVATPGISFAGDQDTGIFRAGANALAIGAGGRTIAIFANDLQTYADTNGYAIDLVGRSPDSAAMIRWFDVGGSTLFGSLNFLPGFGTQLAATIGGLRLSAAPGSSISLRVGGSDVVSVSAASLSPFADNSISLGAAGLRYSQVYATSGTISTSDERIKTWRGPLTANELAAAKAIGAAIGIYQFNSAIAAKGADDARWHVGLKAQEIISILSSHSLDPMRYGFVCHDSWDAVAGTPDVPAIAPGKGDPGSPAVKGIAARAAGDLYAIRHDELAMFILAAQEQRLAALEGA